MAHLMLVNPRKRRSKTRSKKRRSPGIMAKARSSVASVHRSLRRRYRRNPIPKTGDVLNEFKNGAIGAAGALVVDVVMQKAPFIPANLKTGQFAPIVKGLVGIGVGMAVAKFGKNKALGKQLAAGAVTVSLYAAGKQMLAPALGLNGWDDGLLAWNDGLLDYNDGMSAYTLNAYDFNQGSGYVTGAPIMN